MALFGKKKKDKDAKKKKQSIGSVRKKTKSGRAAVVSTPVHYRSQSIRSRKSTRARRKHGRGNILPHHQHPGESLDYYGKLPGDHNNRPIRRDSERMVVGEGGKPVLRAPGGIQGSVPPAPPPPPPPPPPTGISQGGYLSGKRREKSRQTPGMRRKGNSMGSTGGMSTATRERHRATARLENLGRGGRDRTPSDVREWLSWRIKVNEQLTSYVLKDKEDAGNLQINAFPGNIKDDCLNAIFYHAHRKEQPETSLDNLSYITYGIPRVRLAPRLEQEPSDAGMMDQPPVDYDDSSDTEREHARSNLRPRPSLLRRTAIEEIEKNLRAKLRRARSPGVRSPKQEVRAGEMDSRVSRPTEVKSPCFGGKKRGGGRGDYLDSRGIVTGPDIGRLSSSPGVSGTSGFRQPLLCGPRPPVPGAVPTVLCSLADIRRPRLSPRGKVPSSNPWRPEAPCLPSRPANHFGPVFRAPIPPAQRLILNRAPEDRVAGQVNPIYEQPTRQRPAQADRTNNVDYRAVLKRTNQSRNLHN